MPTKQYPALIFEKVYQQYQNIKSVYQMCEAGVCAKQNHPFYMLLMRLYELKEAPINIGIPSTSAEYLADNIDDAIAHSRNERIKHTRLEISRYPHYRTDLELALNPSTFSLFEKTFGYVFEERFMYENLSDTLKSVWYFNLFEIKQATYQQLQSSFEFIQKTLIIDEMIDAKNHLIKGSYDLTTKESIEIIQANKIDLKQCRAIGLTKESYIDELILDYRRFESILFPILKNNPQLPVSLEPLPATPNHYVLTSRTFKVIV